MIPVQCDQSGDYFLSFEDVLTSLESVHEDSIVLLHREGMDARVRCNQANHDGREQDSARELVEWESYSEGWKDCLALVSKHFEWIEEHKEYLGVKK